MNTLIIVLSGLISLAIASIGLVWLPYGPEATRDIIFPHYFATIATVFSVTLIAIYLIVSNKKTVNESYGQIVTTAYLIFASVVTIIMYAKTYSGFGYDTFLVVEIILYILLALIWGIAAKVVTPAVASREMQQRVSSYRKSNITNDLYDLSNIIPLKFKENSTKALKSISDLSDELKYFPNSAEGVEAEEILRNVKQWIQSTNNLLASEIEASSEMAEDLAFQAKDLQRKIAQYRKV